MKEIYKQANPAFDVLLFRQLAAAALQGSIIANGASCEVDEVASAALEYAKIMMLHIETDWEFSHKGCEE